MSGAQPSFVRSEDGTQIALHAEGSGPPLVLVYGALADWTYWRALTPFLRDRFQTIIFERRGRGASGDVQPYAAEREVEDLRAALASIGQPYNVFGHSSGAILALEAANGLDDLRRLMLYEPPVNAHSRGEDAANALQARLKPRLERLLAAGDRGAAVDLFLREAAEASREAIERIKEGRRWSEYLALAHTTLYDSALVSEFNQRDLSFPGWEFPVHLLAGGASPGDMVSGVRALAAALPGSGLTFLENEGHNAVYTAPNLIARLITNFFV